MRLLVVGASGLVGSELCRRARRDATHAAGSVPAAALRDGTIGAARRVEGEATEALDLLDRASIEAALERLRPDTIAICSAWPDVDGCERDPERSRLENVTTIENLVGATRGTATRLLFFSTDHVFDGSRDRPSLESDAVHPRSVYARHKREVEELLLARGHSLVCRTAWVFGEEARRKNFVYRVMRHAFEGLPLAVPSAQSGCPTWTGWLADSVLALLEQRMTGIVHLSGGEEFTKAEWAAEIVEGLGLPALRVVEMDWRDSGQVAPRPARVALASERHTLVQPPVRGLLRSLAL